jgi:RHS repeat-associated protein
VLDTAGRFVNREEYSPYGETSFGSYARKRYRYTGKERDEESGLSYHGARYYAPWLGRWTSRDPAATELAIRVAHDPPAMVNGSMTYGYAGENPMRFEDPTGLAEEDPHLLQHDIDNLGSRVHQHETAVTSAQSGLAKTQQLQQAANESYKKSNDYVQQHAEEYGESPELKEARTNVGRQLAALKELRKTEYYYEKALEEEGAVSQQLARTSQGLEDRISRLAPSTAPLRDVPWRKVLRGQLSPIKQRIARVAESLRSTVKPASPVGEGTETGMPTKPGKPPGTMNMAESPGEGKILGRALRALGIVTRVAVILAVAYDFYVQVAHLPSDPTERHAAVESLWRKSAITGFFFGLGLTTGSAIGLLVMAGQGGDTYRPGSAR